MAEIASGAAKVDMGGMASAGAAAAAAASGAGRHEIYSEQLSQVPEFASLGPLFKSSEVGFVLHFLHFAHFVAILKSIASRFFPLFHKIINMISKSQFNSFYVSVIL